MVGWTYTTPEYLQRCHKSSGPHLCKTQALSFLPKSFHDNCQAVVKLLVTFVRS